MTCQVGCLAPGCSYDMHVACGRNAHVAAKAACAQMQDRYERLKGSLYTIKRLLLTCFGRIVCWMTVALSMEPCIF